MMTNILVLGAGGTAGINFIKSLRMSNEKYNIIGGDINKWHLYNSGADIYVQTAPYDDFRYIHRIKEIIEEYSIDFIHAQPDVEVEKISENRNLLKCSYFLPAHDTILKCRNKYTTYKILKDFKIPVPESYIYDPETVADVFNHLQRKINSVDLFKMKVWVRIIKGAGSRGTLPVTSVSQAINWVNYWRETKNIESNEFMLCEYLPHREFAFQSLWFNGKIITSACRQRVEYLMGNLFPSGQSSSPSIAISVHNDRVNKIASDAILAIDSKATGIFCVDLKEDIKDVPCITEINAGRFFTSSDFFSTIGNNMPHVYVQLGMLLSKLPEYDSVPKDQVWVRGIDVEPSLKIANGENEWVNVRK